jgi:hypothetical protein
MRSAKVQYTVRGVEPNLDRVLRRIAKENQMSLNRFLMQELESVANRFLEPIRHHDLDFAIGSMTDGQLIDRALADFALVDPGLWE